MKLRTALTGATVVALALPAALVVANAASADGQGARGVDAAGPLTRYAATDTTGRDITLPATARTRVRSVAAPSGKTIVTMIVDGFPAGRAYGAHAHVSACGATPASSGGHYQHVVSTDPAYATPENEVWLDFTTNADGHGEATAVVDWHFTRDLTHAAGANAVVVHRDETSTGQPGQPAPGVAGPRLGCLTVPFSS